MEIICVKANNGVFVNFNNDYIFNYDNLIINGNPIRRSFKTGWYICDGIPQTVSKLQKESPTNKRFELREDRITPLFKGVSLPKVFMAKDVVNDNGDYIQDFDYIKNFYDYEYDTHEKMVDVSFNLHHVLDIDAEIGTCDISFPVYKTRWKHEGIETIKNPSIKTAFEYELLYPSIMKEHLPCSLSSKQVFDIVRYHILTNINPQYAIVTSDYDFCFDVSKRVKLHKDLLCRKEVLTASGRSYKNKKYREYYITHREVNVFHMAPKPYGNYPVIEPIVASSHQELKEKVEKLLTDLMELINTPLTDCPHCNGMGVIENNA